MVKGQQPRKEKTMTTKAQKLAEARELYPRYNITGVKTMTQAEIESREAWGKKSLDDVYANPSEAKRSSYASLMRQYNPQQVIAVSGNSMVYSVLLVAENGMVMHITRDNNYLVEVEA